jgi:ubiquinone/menaquinone biosynthesis C-methylase UbiE
MHMDEWLRRVVDQADAFKQSMIILTAAELDLFTVLGTAWQSERQMVRRLGTDPRATRLWLNALAALGVLEKSGARYRSVPDAQRFFDRASPEYRGAFLRHITRYWPQWAALTDVVCPGEVKPRGRRDGGTAADFAWAMHDLSIERAEEVARILWDATAQRRAGKTSATALDLGGGPGTYAVAMAKRNPSLTVTVFDRQKILAVAREVAARQGLTNRVAFLAGDFMADGIGSGYDLILASSVIHSYAEREVRTILRKCARALAPHGRLAIHDFLLDETMTRPVDAALFSVHMLVVGAAGRSYSVGEVSRWMVAAGFARPRHIPVRDGASSLLVARRR